MKKILNNEINPKNEFGIKVGGEVHSNLNVPRQENTGCCN